MKKLMKGNEVICHSAIAAGCRGYFGYPITPQNEITEGMAKFMPLAGGAFVQAESETAAVNMAYGSAAGGTRTMTSSSSPGIALKQEGISYLAGAELPCVIVSVSRGGPGLGGIQPSQADYYQATKGGGNGDYSVPVLTPETVQELGEFTQKAFHIADKYRTPVMVLCDGVLAQMMEPVEEIKPLYNETFNKDDWSVGIGGDKKVVSSLYLNPNDLENHSIKLKAKTMEIAKNEAMYESYNLEGADVVIVSYGISSRIARKVIADIDGVNVGLVSLKTINPFPTKFMEEISSKTKFILALELSLGQMVNDLKLVVENKLPVEHYGRTGGIIFTEQEIIDFIKEKKGEYDGKNI